MSADVNILIDAQDRASGILGSVAGAIGRMGEVAGGIVSANIFGNVANGISSMTQEAMGAVSQFQTLQIRLEGLVARELANGQTTEVATQSRIALSQKEQAELDKLTKALPMQLLERQKLADQIKDDAVILQINTDQRRKSANALQIEADTLAVSRQRLEQLDSTIATAQGTIGTLTAKNGELVTSLQKIQTGQMSMTDAMAQAGPKAQELLSWVRQMAVTTPFTVETISQALSMGMAMGQTSAQAKEMTTAMVNFASGMGLGQEQVQRVTFELGQMQQMGKLDGRVLRELEFNMVPVNSLLDDMAKKHNTTTESIKAMVAAGQISTDEFMQTFVTMANRDFSGAAGRMSRTLQGVTSNIQDFIQSVLGSTVLGPAMQHVSDMMADALDSLMKPEYQAFFVDLGKRIGAFVGDALPRIVTLTQTIAGNFFDAIGRIRETGMSLIATFQRVGPSGLLSALGFDPKIVSVIMGIGHAIGETFQTLRGYVDAFRSGGAVNLMYALGLDYAQIAAIMSALQRLGDFLGQALPAAFDFLVAHSEAVKGALLGIGAVLAAGAIMGTIGGIVFAIGELASGIGPLIAVAALLGAAWSEDWGGIREITQAAWQQIQPVLERLAGWLSLNVPAAMQRVSAFWESTLRPTLAALAAWLSINVPIAMGMLVDFWTSTLEPTLEQLGGWLGTNIPIAMQALSDFWNTTLLPSLSALGGWLSTNIPAAFKALQSGWNDTLRPALQAIPDFVTNTLIPGLSKMSGWFTNDIPAAFRATTAVLSGTLQPALTTLSNIITNNVMPPLHDMQDIVILLYKIDLTALSRVFNEVLLPALNGFFTKTKNDVTPSVNALQQVVNDFLLPAVRNLGDFIAWGLNAGLSNLHTLTDGLVTLFGSLFTAVLKLDNDGLQVLLKMLPEIQKGFKLFIDNEIDKWLKSWDAFLSMLKTIKQTLQDVLNLIQQTNTGGGGGNNARANGGPVNANTPYIVGEHGPEIFVPRGSGAIIPNNQLPALAGGQQMQQSAPVVNVYATIQNGMDIEDLAYRIAQVIQRRSQ